MSSSNAQPSCRDGEATEAKSSTEQQAAASAHTTLLFASLYALVSSTLGIANKWALIRFPYAGLLTAAQFGFTALVVLTLDRCDMLTPKLESMNFAKLKQMTPITCIFYMAIFSNTKILQFATVELFIAFRSATPIFVCLIDTLVRNQPSPSFRTVICLTGILVGACGFAATDTTITEGGYIWAFVYLAIITTEMVYAKHVRGLACTFCLDVQMSWHLFVRVCASLRLGDSIFLAGCLRVWWISKSVEAGVGVRVWARVYGRVCVGTRAHTRSASERYAAGSLLLLQWKHEL